MRLVDEVQFQRRRTSFDFDMMIGSWIASPSPGNEQRGRWSSAAADAQGATFQRGEFVPVAFSCYPGVAELH